MTATVPTSIQRRSQKLEFGEKVWLYQIDLSPVGENILLSLTSSAVQRTFDGIVYVPVDLTADGFEYNGQGVLPQPKVSITALSSLVAGLVRQYDDLVGCNFTRIRTYEAFLDNGATPDPNAFFPPDNFVFEQKTQHDNAEFAWTLSAAMDQQGRKIPGRLIIRDTCMWRYRIYKPSNDSWDYSKATCPYTGNSYFDRDNNPKSAKADDVCGRDVPACKKRFGANKAIPFGGFPGVARFRT